MMIKLLYILCYVNAFTIPMTRTTFLRSSLVGTTTNLLGQEEEEDKKVSAITVIDNDIYFCGELNDENCVKLTQTFLVADKSIENEKKKIEVKKEVLMNSLELDNSTIIEDDLPDHVNFFIQSPGGSFLATLGLMDTIYNLRTPVYTYVHGYAASAATLLSVTGRKRYMYRNSVMLIHGIRMNSNDAKTMNEIDDVYDNVHLFTEMMKNIYLVNSNIKESELESMLKHDKYIGAEQAKEYGLIDEII